MTTWNSRLLLRRDRAGSWNDQTPHALEKGELAIAYGDNAGEIRIGIEDSQPWAEACSVMAWGPGTAPLLAGEALDGQVLAYQGGEWLGAEVIGFEAALPTGAVTYNAATRSYGTDTSVTLTRDLDGGSFQSFEFRDTTPPAFAESYQPAFSDVGTTEPYSAPSFAPGYAPSIGES